MDKVEKIIRNDILIEVNYLDSVGNKLRDSKTIQGKYLDDLDVPFQTIPGYILSTVQNFQKKFIPNSDGINIIYAKQVAAPVIIYHRNIDDKLIADPIFLTGKFNGTFQAKPLEEARNFLVESPKVVSGKFTDQVQEFEFKYNTQKLTPYIIPNNLFLETFNSTQVFERANINYPINRTIPMNSTWKIFHAMKEGYTNRIWYNLGADIWVPSTEDVSTFKIPPYQLENQSQIKNSYNYKVIDISEINQYTNIGNFHEHSVTGWVQPYGKMLIGYYQSNQRVFVKNLILLENNSVWAELDDGNYVERQYLNI
ncbi:MucBP domain-containing protein [Companilactobacillus metriopterae]|uniref:MucBP domain-containing protein n=1 Tax=Companilactobacillus metriopterae TaxID=1909267 RepID=UPI00100BE48E|nr:MucBP domain-containing protein [Companilactobacillus metriopterae]